MVIMIQAMPLTAQLTAEHAQLDWVGSVETFLSAKQIEKLLAKTTKFVKYLTLRVVSVYNQSTNTTPYTYIVY